MCLKCPYFWSKHVWNSISAPNWPQYDIPEITPHEGGRPGLHPETEIPNMASQQAIGYQKEIKKTLGQTSETDAYLKFEMTSYVKCQTDL